MQEVSRATAHDGIGKPIRLRDRMLVWMLMVLPHHGLGRLIFHATRWTYAPWKNALIRLFIRAFNVDLGEAAIRKPAGFASFNQFFTRALSAGARPFPAARESLLCPADGAVSQFGAIRRGRLMQAKGHDFGLTDLLGGDAQLAEAFADGEFCTIYLSPRDYHRVHMPIDGQLRNMIHVPGRLFSVQDATARLVDRLYARNERLILRFDTPLGPLGVVMVGAIFVSSVNTAWAGTVNPHGQRRRLVRTDYPAAGEGAVALRRGDEVGSFNMGSTVILLFGKAAIDWTERLRPGVPVRYGDEIARPACREFAGTATLRRE